MIFFPSGSCMAEEGSCSGSTGKARAHTEPSSQHSRAKLLASNTLRLWRGVGGLAAH